MRAQTKHVGFAYDMTSANQQFYPKREVGNAPLIINEDVIDKVLHY